jgi:hypothetical protein
MRILQNGSYIFGDCDNFDKEYEEIRSDQLIDFLKEYRDSQITLCLFKKPKKQFPHYYRHYLFFHFIWPQCEAASLSEPGGSFTIRRKSKDRALALS